MRSQIKSNTSQAKVHVYCKHDFKLRTLKGALIVSLDDSDCLDSISILLDEDNDLEEEITH